MMELEHVLIQVRILAIMADTLPKKANSHLVRGFAIDAEQNKCRLLQTYDAAENLFLF